MSFDPSKSTDVEKMTSADFAVWRTSKQNEVIAYVYCFKPFYLSFRLLRKPLELRSITPPGP